MPERFWLDRRLTDKPRRAVLRSRQPVPASRTPGVVANVWTFPHHVVPFHRSRQTVLADLLGVCTCCHHDVHDGHRTLLLRDGRLINENGWITD